jgi:hypothetical protein
MNIELKDNYFHQLILLRNIEIIIRLHRDIINLLIILCYTSLLHVYPIKTLLIKW